MGDGYLAAGARRSPPSQGGYPEKFFSAGCGEDRDHHMATG